MAAARALHFVFKVPNRNKTIQFCRNVLGMKVLRHEEFEEGCAAACNGPYNGKWSKTMIGYGDEDNHFVIELTYNYEIKSYKVGNDFQGFTIDSEVIKENADKNSYEYKKMNENQIKFTSPCGYIFYANNKISTKDPVIKIGLSVTNLKTSIDYWNNLIGMKLYKEDEKTALLGFADDQCKLELIEIDEPIDHAEAMGRIAFSIESSCLQPLEQKMRDHNQSILTPYISLDTPGKATVQVIILADPDGHEICFVGDEGFRELSKYDPSGDALLDKAMLEDKSEEWFQKKKEREARAANNK